MGKVIRTFGAVAFTLVAIVPVVVMTLAGVLLVLGIDLLNALTRIWHD